MKEKVLFVVPEDYEKIGGIRLPVVQYNRALENVFICEIRKLSYHPRQDEIRKIFTGIDNYSYLVVYGLNQAFALSKFIYRKNIKFKQTIALLVDSEFFYASSVLSTLSLKKSPKQYLHTLAKKVLYKSRERVCLTKFSDVLYVSRVDEEFVKCKYKAIRAKLHVIENGIVAPESIKVRKHDYENFRIGFLSTYSPGVINENLRPIVEVVMPSVIKTHPNAKLVVAGRGEEEFLTRYFKQYDYVEYKGAVDSLESFYEDVDIVLPLTLKRNGILNKILEAWSYGKCVVAYDYNFYAFKEAKKDKHYICDTDIRKIANKVIDIINQDVDIDKIGFKSRQMVIEKYDWKSSREYFKKIFGA